MANNIYIVDQLASGPQTITIDDDGTGIDWMVIQGIYSQPTDFRLGLTPVNGVSTSSSGFYFFPDNTGHRLIVNGLIENVRGSNGQDFIQGNELGNLLMGDAAQSGLGGSDTLWGFDGNDTIYGGNGNDEISGANDRDRLFGNAGVDTINGGAGIDTIEGGTGADVLSGGADNGDTVSYASSSAGVRIGLIFGEAAIGRGGHAEGDRITGFSNIVGSDFADVLTDTNTGNVGFEYNSNVFYGGGGNDVLRLGGWNDEGWGGTGADRIFGEGNNDTLRGGAGADTLRGGEAADLLYGGAEADRFVFAAASESAPTATTRDRIADFSRAQGDKVDLSLIDADLGASGNNAFTWRGTLGFSGDAGQLRWIVSGANALVLGDLDGDRAADFSILVLGIGNLRATDFVL